MKILMVLNQGAGNVLQTIPAYLSLKQEHDVDVVYCKEYESDSSSICSIYPADVIEVTDDYWMREQDNYDYMFKGWMLSSKSSYEKEQVDAMRESDSEVQRNLRGVESLCEPKLLREWQSEPMAIEGDYITVHNGAKDMAEWAMKKYVMFPRVTQQLGVKVVSLGKKNEYIQGTVNRTETSWKQTAYLIEHAKFHISTDTSTMHLAGLVETPGIGIFTATDPRKNWDKDFHHTITPIASDISCAPCQSRYHWHPRAGECRHYRIGYYPCQNVSPQAILEAIPDNLKKH